jgi:dihydroorotase, multifunctional complex type
LSKEANLDEYCIEGKAYIEGNFVDCFILIKGEKIAKISKNSVQGLKTIKLKNEEALFPAATDLHVHFRDWDESYKETIRSGSKAALAGGVTTVLDMPNTKPPVNNLERLEKRYLDFKEKSMVDFGLHVRPSKELNKIINHRECFAVKFYEEDLPSILDYSDTISSKRVVFHAQYGNDEVIAVEDILAKSEKLSNIRFAHVSKAKSLRLIEEFRSNNPNKKVYIEVTPHHTFLSEKDFENKHKGYSSVRPPLSSKEDNSEIINWINNGKIDFIASDHAPHSREEKLSENPPPGYPSIEIMYTLFLNSWLKGILNLDRIIKCLCIAPAEYLGIKKGKIIEGYYADLAIINLKEEKIIDSSKFVSMSKFSPFDGMKIKSIVKTTIMRGKIVYDEGYFMYENIQAKSINELVN